jgi:hypothetical protein
MREIWKLLSRGDCRLFRNNVGTGWAGGKPIRVTAQSLAWARGQLKPGDVIVPTARPLHAGLQVGSADNIGWQTVEIEITPEMVGRHLRLAVFASVESKAARGRMTTVQHRWQQQVQRAGGIAVVARSAAEASKAVEEARSELLRCVTDPT